MHVSHLSKRHATDTTDSDDFYARLLSLPQTLSWVL